MFHFINRWAKIKFLIIKTRILLFDVYVFPIVRIRFTGTFSLFTDPINESIANNSQSHLAEQQRTSNFYQLERVSTKHIYRTK